MDIRYNTHQPAVSQLVFNNSSITWSGRYTSNNHVQDAIFSPVSINDNNTTTYERACLSRSTEVAAIGSAASYQLNGLLSTETRYLSPVIDVSQMGAILVANIINNSDTNETAYGGGDAIAKYVTRPTTLAANQDAEDLIVYLNQYMPSTSMINVYAKIKNAADNDLFDSHAWIKMTPSSTTMFSDISNPRDLREFTYTMPASVKTATNGAVQYVNSGGVTFTGYLTFAIKIVMMSSESSVVPLCEKLRVICVQM
jgi:hypothetical protein